MASSNDEILWSGTGWPLTVLYRLWAVVLAWSLTVGAQRVILDGSGQALDFAGAAPTADANPSNEPCTLTWPRKDLDDVCTLYWVKCGSSNHSTIVPWPISYTDTHCVWDMFATYFEVRHSNCHGKLRYRLPSRPRNFSTWKEITPTNFYIHLKWEDPVEYSVLPVGYRVWVRGAGSTSELLDIASVKSKEGDIHRLVLTTHLEACADVKHLCIVSNLFRNNLISPNDNAFVIFHLVPLPVRHSSGSAVAKVSVQTSAHLPTCRQLKCPQTVLLPHSSTCPEFEQDVGYQTKKICECAPLLARISKPTLLPGTNDFEVTWEPQEDENNIRITEFHVYVYRNRKSCPLAEGLGSIPGSIKRARVSCPGDPIQNGDRLSIQIVSHGSGYRTYMNNPATLTFTVGE